MTTALPATASAQDRLFLDQLEVDVAGEFGRSIRSVPHDVHGKTAGAGRYLVRFTTALDTATGARIALPGGWMLDVDPTRPRAFMYDGTEVSVVDVSTGARTVLTVALHPYPRGFVSASYAPDTDELFLRRRGADDASVELAVLNPATGAVTRVLPQVWEHDWDWHVTGDGRFVVAMTFADFLGGTYAQGVHLLDAQTGARLSSHPRSEVARVIDDRRFNRTYAIGRGGLVALDRQLTPLAVVPLPASCYPSMALSAHTDRLYVMSAETPSLMSNGRYLLTSYDVAAGRLLASAEVTNLVGQLPTNGSCNSLPAAVLTAPPPPEDLEATTTGRDVRLTWQAVGAASFVLEAGLTPGRTDVTMPAGAATQLTIPNVPPGTYYVRVRAAGAFGISRPSSDVVVTVP